MDNIKILLKKSNSLIEGAPVAPRSNELEAGEVAVNYAESAETIFIKNDNGDVVPFSSDNIINQRISESALPTVTSVDNLKVLQVVDGEWTVVTPLVVYTGSQTPPANLGNDGDIYIQTADSLREPDVLYETDGTTGLLGHNNSTVEGQWQIENLDLSAYTHLRCYFSSGSATGDSRTPGVVVEVPVDDASIGVSGYIGSAMVAMPFSRTSQYIVSCAVDSTKTKFQVIHQNVLSSGSASDANSNGRYCYKIEGWY